MTSWTAPPRGGGNLAGTSRSEDMCKQMSFLVVLLLKESRVFVILFLPSAENKVYESTFLGGTVPPACMVHGCKVNPLVWSIFGWSRTE